VIVRSARNPAAGPSRASGRWLAHHCSGDGSPGLGRAQRRPPWPVRPRTAETVGADAGSRLTFRSAIPLTARRLLPVASAGIGMCDVRLDSCATARRAGLAYDVGDSPCRRDAAGPLLSISPVGGRALKPPMQLLQEWQTAAGSTAESDTEWQLLWPKITGVGSRGPFRTCGQIAIAKFLVAGVRSGSGNLPGWGQSPRPRSGPQGEILDCRRSLLAGAQASGLCGPTSALSSRRAGLVRSCRW